MTHNNNSSQDKSMGEHLATGFLKLFIFSVGVFAFKKFLYGMIYEKQNKDTKNEDQLKEKFKEKKKELKDNVEDVTDDNTELTKEVRNLLANALSKASNAIKP